MITKEIKLSSKNQVVLPKIARSILGIKTGDRIIISIDPHGIYIRQKPKNWLKHMRGLGKEMWQAVGGGDKYIRDLRKEWDDRENFLEKIRKES